MKIKNYVPINNFPCINTMHRILLNIQYIKRHIQKHFKDYHNKSKPTNSTHKTFFQGGLPRCRIFTVGCEQWYWRGGLNFVSSHETERSRPHQFVRRRYGGRSRFFYATFADDKAAHVRFPGNDGFTRVFYRAGRRFFVRISGWSYRACLVTTWAVLSHGTGRKMTLGAVGAATGLRHFLLRRGIFVAWGMLHFKNIYLCWIVENYLF